ncbi:MAG: hypothetical protein ACI9G1_004468 [Pirellulaceae bacterium]|jgi:hypothetical protein
MSLVGGHVLACLPTTSTIADRVSREFLFETALDLVHNV